MSVQMQKKQIAVGEIKVTDKNGDPAKFQEGSLKATFSNEEVATVAVEGNKVTLKSVGIGAGILTLSLDANLTDDGDPTTGDDVREITAEVAVEVAGGEATSLGIDFQVSDAPEEEAGGGEGSGGEGGGTPPVQ